MVGEAVELAEIEFRRRNVRLTHHIARGCRPAVDPILIEQVLVNLMKNAAESIDAQRPPRAGTSELRVVPPDRIEDSAWWSFRHRHRQGPGPEVMERLFEAFFSPRPRAWASA